MQEKNAMIEKDQTVFVAGEKTKQPEHLAEESKTANLPSSRAIADRLRTARLSANLTQQELAGGLFSKSYISAVERGKMIPSLQALNVLAQRLAVPVAYLLGEQNIDLVALEESSAVLRSSEEQISAAPTNDPILLLDKAEAFLREDQAQEALTLLGESETPPTGLLLLQWLRWYRLVGWAAGLLGDQEKAIRLLERGLELSQQIHLRIPTAEQPQLKEMVGYLHCFLGNAYCSQDKIDQALDYYQRGLEAIRKDQVHDPELKALIYKGLGRSALALGNYQEASAYYQEALKQAEIVKDQRLLGMILWGLASSYQESDEPFRAKTACLKALNALEQHGNPKSLLQIRINLGQVLLQLDDYQGAEQYLLPGMQEAQTLGDMCMYGVTLVNMASLHRVRGELPQALALIDTARQLLQQHPSHRIEGQMYLTLASIYEAQHNHAAREQAFQDAIRILEEGKEYSSLGKAYESYAQLLSEQGRFQEAFEQMRLAHRPR
ncbi:MAG TPA: helix-turn-helix transcriptional regulator [Ktedonobacterales bacterium]|jgi:tetratricopeptide (TPR) repeat protein